MKRHHTTEEQTLRIDSMCDDEDRGDTVDVREEIRVTVLALMPWGVSILAHVALIAFAFFLVWQTIVEDEHDLHTPSLSPTREVTVLTSDVTDLTEENAAGGAAFSVEAAPVKPVDITTVGHVFNASSLQTGQAFEGLSGLNDGPGQGPGTPGILGGTDADTIVYLIDASGSMVDVLPFVVNELKRVVNELQPRKQGDRLIPKRISVIFFSGKGVYEVPGGGGVKGLREATPKFKDDIRQWVSLEHFKFEVGGRGSTHVAEALTRTLSYRPQVVRLLSDNLTGGGQGATQHELMQDDLIALIHAQNKAIPCTRIDTIQFLYEDPLVRQGLQGTLDRIAEETGGEARFVGPEDLNLR